MYVHIYNVYQTYYVNSQDIFVSKILGGTHISGKTGYVPAIFKLLSEKIYTLSKELAESAF